MLDIFKKIPKGYFQTEFDLVNETNFPVSFNLFDVNTLSVFETQPLPVLPPSIVTSSVTLSGVLPSEMVYNPNSNVMYVCNSSFSGSVLVIDCNTNTIITNILIGVQLVGIAYNSFSNKIYTVSNISESAYVIDCSTNTLINTIPLLVGSASRDLTYCPLNNSMYIANQSLSSVSVLDCSSDTLVGSPILLAFSAAPIGITYNSINNSVYTADIGGFSSTEISCSTNTVVGSPIPVGVNPFSITYNSLNNSMYVNNITSNDVSVIDCNTNLVVSTISIGDTPYQSVYNSILNLVYLTNIISGDVIVIDCATNSIINNIVLGNNPSGIGFNSLDNTILVGTNANNTVSVISPLSATTTYIGGSFNYNQFIQDIQDNPVLVRDVMFYSSDPENINQVFFTLFKDADGKSNYKPRYPQLSIGVNQFQGSVSKVDFGEKGVLLDSNNSFYDVTVQANSTLKLILIMKQMKKSYSLDAPDISENMDLIKNNVQYILGVDGRNNIERFSVFNLGENEK